MHVYAVITAGTHCWNDNDHLTEKEVLAFKDFFFMWFFHALLMVALAGQKEVDGKMCLIVDG